MDRFHTPLSILVLLLSSGCTHPPRHEVKLEVLGAGIIERQGIAWKDDADSSVGAKRADARVLRIVKETRLVPLQPGISYGISFRVTQAPQDSVQLRAVLKTSAACKLKSSGEVVYHNNSVLSVRVGDVRHLAATIPATAEQNHCEGDPLPGMDTFTLLHGERKLAEASFQIHRPDAK